MNDEKQYLKDKYKYQLSEINRFPVWTLEQLKDYLHICWDTVQLMVANDLLYDFKYSCCKFYSPNNKYYTGKMIRKSVLNIDSYYNFVTRFNPNLKIDDKSLIARNVKRLGNSYNDGRLTDYYSCALDYPLDSIDSYKRLVKLLVDIQAYSELEYVYVYVLSPSVKDLYDANGEFWTYMLNDSYLQNEGYYTAHYVDFSVSESLRSCFKYVTDDE